MNDRSRARMLAFRRAVIAAGAVFATVFTLLAANLWFGNDPALGDSAGRDPAPKQDLHASVIDTIVGVASGFLEDDDHEGGRSQAPSVRSSTS